MVMYSGYTASTESQSRLVTECFGCKTAIEDKDMVITIANGIYYKPPVEQVSINGSPIVYHENCFIALTCPELVEEV